MKTVFLLLSTLVSSHIIHYHFHGSQHKAMVPFQPNIPLKIVNPNGDQLSYLSDKIVFYPASSFNIWTFR